MKDELLVAGFLFVAGLLSIAIAQAFAFFVEARRAEAEHFLARRQMIMLAAEHYPRTDLQEQRTKEAADLEKKSNKKMDRSDWWRRLALLLGWLALACFILGCYFGMQAILHGVSRTD